MNVHDTVAELQATAECEAGILTSSAQSAAESWEGQADAVLVRQAQAGSTEALDSLLRRHHSRLLSHARRQCGACGMVEDLCQETCLTLISHLSDLREPEAFPCWIQTCLDNAARHCRRKNCKRVGTPMPEDGPYQIEGLSVEAPCVVEADWQFLWSVLWEQSGGMGGRLGRTGALMLESYAREEEFPSVRTLAEATHTGYGTAERSRSAVLRSWRRALTVSSLHP